ncbi:DUF1559 family PulG-like putative transporter [Roseiconus lacunae]|uniref:DUF1559 family PulG-like putative transporter n=1 Tax=Roseiconus lacunae TaxID=2605694 RepID=UPI0011F3C9B8|nr:DUF1559 domain-containing protein [Roseiconus lacunae]
MFKNCRAFTLVELLVVIAIIGILVGIMAPALQAMRESARRTQCQSNLISIGLAMQSYHDRWSQFPMGTIADSGPIRNEPSGSHHNWLGRLTEFLDQPVIAANIDRSVSIYDEKNADVLALSFPGVRCPSDVGVVANASSYVGLHHPTAKPIEESDWGMSVLNQALNREDVLDGLSNTVFVSEKITTLGDLGWLSGTRATLRNTGGGIQTDLPEQVLEVTEVGTIGSRHPGGAHLLFGAGEVRFQTEMTDQRILEQLADRRDGQLPLQFMSIDQQRRQSVQ